MKYFIVLLMILFYSPVCAKDKDKDNEEHSIRYDRIGYRVKGTNYVYHPSGTVIQTIPRRYDSSPKLSTRRDGKDSEDYEPERSNPNDRNSWDSEDSDSGW